MRQNDFVLDSLFWDLSLTCLTNRIIIKQQGNKTTRSNREIAVIEIRVLIKKYDKLEEREFSNPIAA